MSGECKGHVAPRDRERCDAFREGEAHASELARFRISGRETHGALPNEPRSDADPVVGVHPLPAPAIGEPPTRRGGPRSTLNGDVIRAITDVAHGAPRAWPSLAPLGGASWSAEDVDEAMGALAQVAERPGFARVMERAQDASELRRYLARALRNELLRRKRSSQRRFRIERAFADVARREVEGGESRATAAAVDAAADAAVRQLGADERAVLDERLKDPRRTGTRLAADLDMTVRTFRRRWAAVCEKLCSAAERHDMDSFHERLQFLREVGLRLAGPDRERAAEGTDPDGASDRDPGADGTRSTAPRVEDRDNRLNTDS